MEDILAGVLAEFLENFTALFSFQGGFGDGNRGDCVICFLRRLLLVLYKRSDIHTLYKCGGNAAGIKFLQVISAVLFPPVWRGV